MLESITPSVLFSATSTAVAVTGAIAGLIAYRVKAANAMRDEMGSKMSRQEHTEICDKQNIAIQQKLDLIVERIDEGNAARQRLSDFVVQREDLAITGREKIAAELATIQTKLAVISATAKNNATIAASTAATLTASVAAQGAQPTVMVVNKP